MLDNEGKTLWCGNLSELATEEILYELFLQAGPLEKVNIARDKDGRQKTFAFIKFCHEVSVPYAISLFRGTTLFNRTMSLQSRGNNHVALPPPIRCFGPETPNEEPESEPPNSTQTNVNMRYENERNSQTLSSTVKDDLTKASLLGHWPNRYKPYHAKEKKYERHDYKPRDCNHKHNRASSNWKNKWPRNSYQKY